MQINNHLIYLFVVEWAQIKFWSENDQHSLFRRIDWCVSIWAFYKFVDCFFNGFKDITLWGLRLLQIVCLPIILIFFIDIQMDSLSKFKINMSDLISELDHILLDSYQVEQFPCVFAIGHET